MAEKISLKHLAYFAGIAGCDALQYYVLRELAHFTVNLRETPAEQKACKNLLVTTGKRKWKEYKTNKQNYNLQNIETDKSFSPFIISTNADIINNELMNDYNDENVQSSIDEIERLVAP